MFRAFRIPISWSELAKRTGKEVLDDDCLGLAAELSYYFFLALFPALLFLVAIISFIPVEGLLDALTRALARVAPGEVLSLVQAQILKIAHDRNGGLLTIGMLGTIWSSSSGVTAIIDAFNKAYNVKEGRPWWKVRLTALGLTLALATFIVLSFVLLLVGPTLAEKIAVWFHVGPAFTWTWKIAQWPVIFALVSLAIALVYYFGPDVRQQWMWITPGTVLATALWLVISFVFKFYVAHFTSYNAAYGAIGGVIVTMVWFYVSSLAILAGAEVNSEIEHASLEGKRNGEKAPGEERTSAAAGQPPPPPPPWTPARRPAVAPHARLSDWLLGGLFVAEVAVVSMFRIWRRPRTRA